MNKNVKRIVVWNVLVILLLNGVFWICCSYPKYIVDWTEIINNFSLSLLVESFLRLLYYVLYFSSLILFFARNKCIFCNEAFKFGTAFQKQDYIKKLCVFLGLRLLLDLLCSNVQMWLPYVGWDIGIVLEWLFIYAIVVKRQHSLTKNKRIAVVTILILAITLGIKIFLSSMTLFDCIELCEKYKLTSPYLQQYMKNAEFLQSVRSVGFDTWIGGVVVSFHALTSIPRSTKRIDDFDTSLKTKARSRDGMVNCIRIAILCVVAVAMCSVKALICPDNFLAKVDISHFSTTRDVLDGSFYEGNDVVWTVWRNKNGALAEPVYVTQTVWLVCDQKKVAKLNACEYDPMFDSYQPTSNGRFNMFTIEDIEVYIYENAAVSFWDNGSPRTVKFQDVRMCEKNSVLIQTFERMIEQGNVIAFEYGFEYLYQYDRQFIEPYIERYASARFTPVESKMIDEVYYQYEYLVWIAQQFCAEK